MAQSGTPVSKKPSKKFNMGAKWHGEHTTDSKGNKVFNCACKGQPQAVSPRLAQRLADHPTKDVGKLHFIKPGSQNRKK